MFIMCSIVAWSRTKYDTEKNTDQTFELQQEHYTPLFILDKSDCGIQKCTSVLPQYYLSIMCVFINMIISKSVLISIYIDVL